MWKVTKALLEKDSWWVWVHLGAHLRAYTVAVMVMKKVFFSATSVLIKSCPVKLFWLLWWHGTLDGLLWSICVNFLVTKFHRLGTTWIPAWFFKILNGRCVQFVPLCELLEIYVAWGCEQAAWNSKTSVISHCPFWLIKRGRQGLQKWMEAIVNTSLENEMWSCKLERGSD